MGLVAHRERTFPSFKVQLKTTASAAWQWVGASASETAGARRVERVKARAADFTGFLQG